MLACYGGQGMVNVAWHCLLHSPLHDPCLGKDGLFGYVLPPYSNANNMSSVYNAIVCVLVACMETSAGQSAWAHVWVHACMPHKMPMPGRTCIAP